MGNSWFRNAFLIQLTGLAWLFSLLLATLVALRVFLVAGQHAQPAFSSLQFHTTYTEPVLMARDAGHDGSGGWRLCQAGLAGALSPRSSGPMLL